MEALFSVQKSPPPGGPPLGSARRSPGLPFTVADFPCLGAVLLRGRQLCKTLWGALREPQLYKLRCSEAGASRELSHCTVSVWLGQLSILYTFLAQSKRIRPLL